MTSCKLKQAAESAVVTKATELGAPKNRQLSVEVYRFRPDQDPKPFMQRYQVNSLDCPGVMVLDLLEAIKIQDPSLTFRRSCSEGVCGSDGMNINGKNRLACVSSFLDLGDSIVIRPLPGFPVIRDLIVDMKQFFAQYERVKPYLQNDQPVPEKERLQSIEDRAKLDGLYECILCACCSSSCPSYWWNPDKFLGPAPLLWANRFIVDSRDTFKQQRLEELQDPYSLMRCRTIMSCADVCPKELNPTKAIGHIRQEMLEEFV